MLNVSRERIMKHADSESVILQTAFPASVPEGTGLGVGGTQWFGARFSILHQAYPIRSIDVELSGMETFYAAIVPLDGTTGLPAFSPAELGSRALAGVAVDALSETGLPLVPADVILEPGDCGVLFGAGLFGTDGFANLTTGNIPTEQA
jgi:hypothetical protein